MTSKSISAPVKYNHVLNPKLWEHDKLKSSVRGALLRIAEDFKDFVDVPFRVVDIVITGGNANYNYTEHSDIDLHLVTDFDEIECDKTAEELFDTKRLLYKRDYDVEIHGIPVELYVEDSDTPAVSGGCYSVVKGRWLKEPNPRLPKYDKEKLKYWVGIWHEILKSAMKTGSLQTCRNSVKLLRRYRKMGLATRDGEFSIPNLVYKSLRNDKTLEAITIMIDRLHDSELSLD